MEVAGYLTLNVSRLHLGKYPSRSGQVNPAIITFDNHRLMQYMYIHVYLAVGQLHVDVTSRIQALSLVEADCADVVVVAAAGGDLRTLMDYLKKHPDHVRPPCSLCLLYDEPT